MRYIRDAFVECSPLCMPGGWHESRAPSEQLIGLSCAVAREASQGKRDNRKSSERTQLQLKLIVRLLWSGVIGR
jgi:hypothetical protein